MAQLIDWLKNGKNRKFSHEATILVIKNELIKIPSTL